MTDKQRATAELQQWLRNINKGDSEAPTLIPDGIFSTETRLYVENFQRENGLPVTGVADYRTWEAIKRADSLVTAERLLPTQVAPVRDGDLPLIKGMDNRFTDTLKLMLNYAAEAYDNFELIEEEGFGEKTQAAVRHWQEIAFVEKTGQVDKVTWNSLAAFYLTK